MNKRKSGKNAEDIAEEYLKSLGYEILAKNFMISHNEIDILAKDGNYLVFVEVRSKSDNYLGTPEESITQNKRKQLIKAVNTYLSLNPQIDNFIRLDFIGVIFENGKPIIKHLINAF